MNQRNQYTAISKNLIVTNLNWRNQAAIENNFVYILDKHSPKKRKTLREKQKPILIRIEPLQANDDYITSQKQGK